MTGRSGQRPERPSLLSLPTKNIPRLPHFCLNLSKKERKKKELILAITGFWTGQDFLEPNFEALEAVRVGQYCLMDYLHGWCFAFALALHDVFGFPICLLADTDELGSMENPNPDSPVFPLIHGFCAKPSPSGVSFLDCRGSIDNEQTFLEEFRDFFTDYIIIKCKPDQIQTIRKRQWYGPESKTARKHYLYALNYVKTHIQDFTGR